MVTLLPIHEKAISCMSVEEHDFLNYGEIKFFNYIVDLYVSNNLCVDKAVDRAHDELDFVRSLLN
jgi:hypothetical protein